MELCEPLETSEEIFHTQSELNHQEKNRQSSEHHQSAKSVQKKCSNQATKPTEEDKNENAKTKNRNLPVCTLHGPGHNMNSCKVMQLKVKAMKLNWLTSSCSRAGLVQFQGTKKRPSEGQELNALVVNASK